VGEDDRAEGLLGGERGGDEVDLRVDLDADPVAALDRCALQGATLPSDGPAGRG
jgi:hypothetical protein